HKNRTSVNINNQPIPWFTYSFIDFLEGRLNKNLSIFEYGSGNSTRYFAERVRHISSLEHDKSWYEMGLKNKLQNAELIFCDLDSDGNYSRGALNTDQKFDIII